MILYWSIHKLIPNCFQYKTKEFFDEIVKDYPALPSIKVLEYE